MKFGAKISLTTLTCEDLPKLDTYSSSLDQE